VPANDSYIETEVKVRFPAGAEAARERITRAGYSIKEDRTLESDQVFDLADGELKRSDQLLRLRRIGERSTVTYKGPGMRGRHKQREEIEFDVSDAGNFAKALDRLGYAPRFRYEKYRTKFARQGEPGEVTIDETPIGVFLELEGPPDWIDRAAERLGLSHDEYITRSYGSLYQEYRRLNQGAPENMTFDSQVDSRTS
jgi:adenylate cyclase class 2